MRLWVLLLALIALSATSFAQDFDGDEEPQDAIATGEEVNGGEEEGNTVGASEDLPEDDVTPNEENEQAQIESELPDDNDEAHVEESNGDGVNEEELLGDDKEGEEVEINENQAKDIETEEGAWEVAHSEKDGEPVKPEWKTYPLYSGSYDVERDCGCKIKWMKKVYTRPKPKPRFYHFHKSVGFHNHHHHIGHNFHHHHHRRVVPFPRRAHVHHIVRHHVHHKKPCGCLKKTVVKNIVVHHPRPVKHCHGNHHNHHHKRNWRFGRYIPHH